MRRATVVFATLIFLFMLPFFLHPETLTARQNDLDETIYPIVQVWKKSLFEYKTYPVWRDDILGGYPFVIDPQPLMFYPPNWILLFLPFERTSIFLFGLHLFLLGMGTTVFLKRSFGFPGEPSFIAGVALALTPHVIAHMASGHLNMVEAMALVPWVLLSLDLQIRKQSMAAIVPVSFLLSLIYTLYASIWYYTLGIGLIYGGWSVIGLKRRAQPVLLGFILLLLHFSLIAIMLFPQVALRDVTTRSMMTLEDIAIPTWSITRLGTHLLFPVKDEMLATGAESMVFVGWSVLLLLFLGWRQLSLHWRMIAIFTTVIVILYIGGTRFPIFPLAVKLLPGLSYMRGTTRGLIVWIILLSPFIARGMQCLRPMVRRLVSGVVILELFFVGWWWVGSEEILPQTKKMLVASIASRMQEYPGRVFCTTHCLPQRLTSEYGIRLFDGNYPLQLRSTVDALKEAGGYSYDRFSVIHPPYQVEDQKPQPNAERLAGRGVSIVVSPYVLEDKDFSIVERLDGYVVSVNNAARRIKEDQSLQDQIRENAVQWWSVGILTSGMSIAIHGGILIFKRKK